MRISVRFSSLASFSGLAAAILASTALVPGTLHAQSFASSGTSISTNLTPSTSRPAWHETTPDKLISAHVHEGVLTIDGLTAKVRLNYDIHNVGYLYFFIPGTGTAIVSLVKTPDSSLEKGAFRGNTLAFSVGGHSYELTSEGPLMGGEKSKTDAYVRLDRTTPSLDRYPEMGFGTTTRPPYIWPAAKPEPKQTQQTLVEQHIVQPPPLPRDMLPRIQGSVTTTVPASQP